VASDAHLVALIREGRANAFETVYNRHHRAILSFCRHMLGSVEEAEDAVQHTFLAAYNDLISSQKQIHLRAWLFTIARNRCYSILRARREHPVADPDEPVTEGLAAQVQRRQELRDLVLDLRQLPDDQRAALVLSEMDALSHAEIGDVLGVPRDKVKALVFQARESLVASRAARETDCAEIREQLANLHGGALRRSNLRRHLRECPGCNDFRQEVDRQRKQLRLLLPVVPTLALKETVLVATVGGSAAISAAGGAAVGSSLLKGGVVKSLVGAALAGVGTAGTIVAVHDFQIGTGQSAPRSSHEFASGAAASAARTGSDSDAAASSRAIGATASAYPTAYLSPGVSVNLGAAPSGGAAARFHGKARGAATSTTIAILHPLSRKGLTSVLIPSPLIPANPMPAAPSTGGRRSDTATGGAPSAPTGSLVSNAPNLAPAAFGSGTQAATGGTRTAPGAATTGSSPTTSTPTSAAAPSTSGSSRPTSNSGHGSWGRRPSTRSGSTGSGSGASTNGSGTTGISTSGGGRTGLSASGSTSGSSGPAGGTRGDGGSSSASSGSSEPSGGSTSSSTSTGAATGGDYGTSGGSDSSSGSSGSSSGSSGGSYGGGTDTGPHGR
jgi:RNA polymerase sigma factor (sigma-70 family)